ncbi:MAG TPA: hypothetical protein RMI29_33510 [Polyangiaceae bacterium LLY-WYZ-15_(1-7)]|nr:hypothetical protein [Polyangiaceae bacterium LLY-WYZ-15_(1-7)]
MTSLGCGDDDRAAGDAGDAMDAGGAMDGGARDAGEPDTGQPDAGASDSGADGGALDAGRADAGEPDAGAADASTDAAMADAAMTMDAAMAGDAAMTGDAAMAMDAAMGDAGPGGWVLGTLAGGDAPGMADGTGAAASFRTPSGLGLDADGNVLVADRDNGLIRRVTPAGVVTTLAMPSLDEPADVIALPDGTLVVADRGAHCLRALSPAGVESVFAGACGTSGRADGDATGAARFDRPVRLALDGADVLVADNRNNAIRRVSAGEVTTPVGTLESLGDASYTGALPGRLYYPWGVLTDGTAIWTAGQDHCVREAVGGSLSALAGLCRNFSNTGDADGPGADARFDWPHGMALREGEIVLADQSNHRIRVVAGDGTTRTIAGTTAGFLDGPAASGQLNGPTDVAVAADGTIYVADAQNHRVRTLRR